MYVVGAVSQVRVSYGQLVVARTNGQNVMGPAMITLTITVTADDIGREQ